MSLGAITYSESSLPFVLFDERIPGRGIALDVMSAAETEATLGWLVGALEQARTQGQSKAVMHLQDVADDMVFEVELAARGTSVRS